MEQQADKKIREQLVKQLKGGEAFTPVENLLEEIFFEQTGIVPGGLPYSFYQLFYHIRLAQHDILAFSRNPAYESPKWPEGYWPDQKAPASEQGWQQLVESYFAERKELCDYILDTSNNLLEPFPHGSGQTLLREALLVIEHTSYHTGQLLVVLRLLGLHK
jgi:uncharacterized damage-inducible protein DinB